MQSPPFGSYDRDQAFKSDLEDLLGERSLRNRGWFRPDAVRKLIDLDRAQRIDGGYTILSLMCLELWARQVLDAPIAS